MNKAAVAILVAALALFLIPGSVVQAQTAPEFRLGFSALANQIPDIVGQPLQGEQFAANGDSSQLTTRGLMVYRKSDNLAMFTDGSRTWVNGPSGVVSRLNAERFPFEQSGESASTASTDAGLTLQQVNNTQYVIEGRTIQFTNGMATLQPTGTAQIDQQHVAFGDLNGDGLGDAAVILTTQPGGTGTFFYLVALLDVNGSPSQAVTILLGDRISVQNLAVTNGEISVQFLTRGPTEPFSTPPTIPVNLLVTLPGGGPTVSGK